ncbi:MAG: hypothetical protein E6Z82_07815, partial [Neisseria sp.]|nr:hypothetical protein [Neisseria sp.]
TGLLLLGLLLLGFLEFPFWKLGESYHVLPIHLFFIFRFALFCTTLRLNILIRFLGRCIFGR